MACSLGIDSPECYCTVCSRKAVKYKPLGWYRSKARKPVWMCREYHGGTQAAIWGVTRTVCPLGRIPLPRAPTAGLHGFSSEVSLDSLHQQ